MYSVKVNVKITDLTELENPYVEFPNCEVTSDGLVLINKNNQSSSLFQKPQIHELLSIFPWLKDLSHCLKRTFKLEIISYEATIVSRYLHFGKLYPIEYAKIA